uniref:Uncharacterized protein n=1 Tax=Branchiostoma floridae TaxID=7739 RepID=C3Z5N6_BRAFL|eukprot:XP_002596137.1 hypothetical protein BRAFLDRAFT_66134 [Branchiostoma floridae]
MANSCPTKDRVHPVDTTVERVHRQFVARPNISVAAVRLENTGWTIAQLNYPICPYLVIYPTQSRLEMATASFGPSQNVSLSDWAVELQSIYQSAFQGGGGHGFRPSVRKPVFHGEFFPTCRLAKNREVMGNGKRNKGEDQKAAPVARTPHPGRRASCASAGLGKTPAPAATRQVPVGASRERESGAELPVNSAHIKTVRRWRIIINPSLFREYFCRRDDPALGENWRAALK